ncbi:protein RRP6-like 3 isoform X1 [Carica papaya]|uniref:protein RRP6-like 3 isoform X1 n=2 Tax=Carica papaya TaxID=3649 RepID=UPI000B8CA22C|nr:protein RRP6-like 3 isoform X1 [Carica papaya]XP_021893705.1 protein RRP6-like 3 isoform X1 [Carica papaya]
MVQYARTDAHYLLYIAHSLIFELKKRGNENSSCSDDKFHFLLEASQRSNMICLQLYTKEVEAFPGDAAASSILSRQINGPGGVSSVSCETQFQDAVRRLCAWRDLMARVHDESLRYVLSDQAIIALANRDPATPTDIYSTIAQADLIADSLNSSSLLSSPSAVVCSHLDDVCQLIQDKSGKLDDILPKILQRCLGPNGTCPLSVFNYALLINCNLKLTNSLISKQNGVKNPKHVSRKASRELFVKRFSCKSPVYHNCRIYANDGRLLCYCDRRKLEWYLHRDLAKLVEEDPPAIMLLFEPKGRPEDEGNDFYIQSKKNICVGCGEGNHYIRYRIIPSCYRVHFPEHLKSHRSHDIVLLCVDCHEIAHSAAEKYKRQISAEFGIPLFVQKVVDSKQAPIISPESSESVANIEEAGVSPLQLRTAAMALLRHGPRMPSYRREELTQTVMKYYGGRQISEEDLERALLVGMSPHEKRRLEKKKGLSLKHSAGTSKDDFLVSKHAAEAKTLPREEDQDQDILARPDNDISDPSTCSEQGNNGVAYTNTSNERNSNGHEGLSTKDADGNCENGSLQNGETDFINHRVSESPLPKHNSKLSLLGHGPHGKQVVDYLLKEYGEEGIRQFCQKWRQVFVEAIHPRFLPAGWDVKHSGKRDFGEFSVYNPAKKVSVAKS